MITALAGRAFRAMGYSVSKIRKLEQLELYRKLYGNADVEKRAFYNVGAGLFRHSAWTNVDHYSQWYEENSIDISYDLLACTPLPIADSSANAVYSSHTIEHITDEAARNLFHEAHRALKDGGFIRLTTPNIDLYYRTVLNSDHDFWKWEVDTYSQPEHMARAAIGVPMNRVSLKQLFLYGFASQTSALHIDHKTRKISDAEFDEIFGRQDFEAALDECKSRCDIELHRKYPGNHVNWWNWNKLERELQRAGFRDIYLSGHGQSACPVLRDTNYFDNTHPNISIYVEAKKGAPPAFTRPTQNR